MAGQREDGLQQHQTRLKVGSDGVLGHTGQNADVVLDEVVHIQVVAEFGEVHGCVLVFGQDVAVSSVVQQEAHYISVPPFTGLHQSRLPSQSLSVDV